MITINAVSPIQQQKHEEIEAQIARYCAKHGPIEETPIKVNDGNYTDKFQINGKSAEENMAKES